MSSLHSHTNHSQLTSNDAFRRILLLEIKSIKQWRKVAIKGIDPEGVHQMRVSLRKMRTALVIFNPLINTQYSRQWTKKLRKYAKLLDDARDLDVYLLNNFTAENQHLELYSAAKEGRSNAYKKVKKLLESKAFNQSLYKSKIWLKQEKWKKQLSKAERKALELPDNAFAVTTLDTLRNNIIAHASHPETLNDKHLHRLRIQCKKLRYAAEFFLPINNQAEKTFIEQLKKIQDCLGGLHDRFIADQLQQQLLHSIDSDQQRLKEVLQLESREPEYPHVTKLKLAEYFFLFCQSKPPW